MRLTLRLFGPPRIELDGTPVELETRKAVALLAYLATTGRPCTRESLVALLWPDSDQSRGRAVLRRTLYAINKTPLGFWLEVRRELVILRDEPGLAVDVVRFRGLVAEASSHCGVEGECCDRCLSLLAEAVSLYEDDFLRGFTLSDSVAFDDWQFFEAEKIRGELGRALERLSLVYAARRQLEAAIGVCRRWLLLDDLNERAHRLLVSFLAAAGQRAGALRQYDECARLLRDQLGAEPAAALVGLRDAILAGRLPEIGPTRAPAAQRDASKPASEEPGSRLATVVCVRAVAPLTRGRIAALVRSVADALGGTTHPADGGVLVVFGMRGAHESDPEVAVRCALEIRAEALREGGSAAAGIQTGEATWTGPGGDDAPAGAVVTAATVLAGVAEPGQILAGESAFRLTRGSFSYFAPCAKTHGGAAEVRAFAVRGPVRVSAKTRGVEGLRSQLIGRESEIGALRELLDAAVSGSGGVACVVGEAGVGKSRLVHELRSRARDAGLRHLWLEGRCLDVAQSTAYGPFVDLMRAQLTSRRGIGADAINRTLRRLVVAGALSASRAAEIGPSLAALLQPRDASGAATRPAVDDPEGRRQAAFAAVRDFHVAVSRVTPIVMVLEDLHWADSLSLDLAAYLMDTVASAAWLLVCVYRPEPHNPCRHLATIASRACAQRFRELRLPDLSPQESRRLAVSLLAGCELPPAIEEEVLGRAQGNPFFLEETLRALIDAGMLRHDGRRWKARGYAGELPIPDSVRGVILGRVDRVGENAREVLEFASVAGSVFSARLLERLRGPAQALEPILRDLEDRALIYPARTLPEPEYAFKHVLTRDTVYAGIGPIRRAALHGEVARALEDLSRESRVDACGALAHHWEKAGDVGKAVAYLLDSGRKAAAESANAEAVRALSRALQLLSRLPESDSRDAQELEILVALGVPLVQLRGHASDDVGEHYERAERLCRRLGDRKRLFHAVLGLRRHALVGGQTRRALALSRQLVDLARSACERARAAFMLCEALLACGAPAEALVQAEAALEAHEPGRSLEQIREFGNDAFAGAGVMGGIAAWLAGRHQTARRMGELAESRARAAGHPFNLAMTLYFAGWLRMLLADDAGGAECAVEVDALSSGRGFPLYALISANLAALLAARRSGGAAATIAELRRTTDEWAAAGNGLFLPRILCSLGEALGRAGEPGAGLEAIRRGLEQSAHSGERVWDAEAFRVRGDLFKALGREAEARRAFARSLAVARRQGALSFELCAALSLGRQLVAAKRGADAARLVWPVLDRFPAETDCVELDDARELVASPARPQHAGTPRARQTGEAHPASRRSDRKPRHE